MNKWKCLLKKITYSLSVVFCLYSCSDTNHLISDDKSDYKIFVPTQQLSLKSTLRNYKLTCINYNPRSSELLCLMKHFAVLYCCFLNLQKLLFGYTFHNPSLKLLSAVKSVNSRLCTVPIPEKLILIP